MTYNQLKELTGKLNPKECPDTSKKCTDYFYCLLNYDEKEYELYPICS